MIISFSIYNVDYIISFTTIKAAVINVYLKNDSNYFYYNRCHPK